MGIGMEGVGLERGLVFEQAIEDVHRFPDTAGNEVAEQRDIGITDMVVGDATKTAIADMPRAQQIVFAQLHMRTIRNRRAPTAPEKGQLEPRVGVDHIPQSGFQFCGRDVLGIEPS